MKNPTRLTQRILPVFAACCALAYSGCAKQNADCESRAEDGVLYAGAFGGLNLREEGNRAAKIIKTLPQYTKLRVLEKGQEDAIDGVRSSWYRVDTGSEAGWVFGLYLTAHAPSGIARPRKPVFMTESRILLFPDSGIINTDEKYYACKMDAIKIYDDTNRESDFSEIKNMDARLFRLPANEDWLYLAAFSENCARHGFISVYDISQGSYYGDFRENEKSGNYYRMHLKDEYAIIQTNQNIRRYGPLLQIAHNNAVIKIWDSFAGDTSAVRWYQLFGYYKEHDEILLYTQFYEGGRQEIFSLRQLSNHGPAGGSVCRIEDTPYFNKSRNAVFSMYSEYSGVMVYLKIFLIAHGAYTPVKINGSENIPVGERRIQNAQWVGDNEFQIRYAGSDGKNASVLTIQRKDAGSGFAIAL